MKPSEQHLLESLGLLAAETHAATASSRVRGQLRAELRRRAWQRRARLWWPALAAAAAVLVLGLWWIGRPANLGIAPPPVIAAHEPVAPAVVEPASPAVRPPAAVPAPRKAPLARWSDRGEGEQAITPWYFNTGLPLEGSGRIVRVKVSAEAAAQFGYFTPAPTVEAQVFLGEDGMARAVRFLR